MESVSVVIATLGGPCLQKTLDFLNKGTVRPEEILICIPEAEASKVEFPEYRNVRIVPTSVRGQVAQRICGFVEARCPLILQLDDDTYFESSCLERLIKVFQDQGPAAAVAPSIFFKSGEYFYGRQPIPDWRWRLLYRVMNGREGFQSGRISRSGINFAIQQVDKPFQQTDWLPGGCILQPRSFLVKENYYPYKGKAYAEDLFYSYFLRKSGASLFVVSDAKCFIDPMPPGFANHFREEVRGMPARFRFARYAGKNRLRMIGYYLLYFLNETVFLNRFIVRGLIFPAYRAFKFLKKFSVIS